MAGCTCNCGGDNEMNLVYSCSGAANTGLLADQVMRTLIRDKVGAGTCLAAMGAGLSGFLASAQSATRNIVLDGCPVACGAKIFQKNEIPFQHYVLTEFGVEKGKTPITGELIEEVAASVTAKVRG